MQKMALRLRARAMHGARQEAVRQAMMKIAISRCACDAAGARRARDRENEAYCSLTVVSASGGRVNATQQLS